MADARQPLHERRVVELGLRNPLDADFVHTARRGGAP
jgi:hypothetical protein